MRSAYLVMVEPDENHNKYYQMTQKLRIYLRFDMDVLVQKALLVNTLSVDGLLFMSQNYKKGILITPIYTHQQLIRDTRKFQIKP